MPNCAINVAFSQAVGGKEFKSESCAQYHNVTPGSIVSRKVQDTLGQDVQKWVNVHELSDLVGAVVNLVVNNLIGTKFMCLSCAGRTPPSGRTVTVTGGGSSACRADIECPGTTACMSEVSSSSCSCVSGPSRPGSCPSNPIRLHCTLTSVPRGTSTTLTMFITDSRSAASGAPYQYVYRLIPNNPTEMTTSLATLTVSLPTTDVTTDADGNFTAVFGVTDSTSRDGRADCSAKLL